MLIIYNPKDGAPITAFISKGILMEPFYPDGYVNPEGKVLNGLIQYEDNAAHELLETYGFLKELTPEQAQVIIDRPQEDTFKCDYPGCDFSTTAKIGLLGHTRKHKKDIEIAGEPAVPASLIPIVGGRQVQPVAKKPDVRDNKDIPNGSDKDGVEWYGEGVTVENNSSQMLRGIRPEGKGHFVG